MPIVVYMQGMIKGCVHCISSADHETTNRPHYVLRVRCQRGVRQFVSPVNWCIHCVSSLGVQIHRQAMVILVADAWLKILVDVSSIPV